MITELCGRGLNAAHRAGGEVDGGEVGSGGAVDRAEAPADEQLRAVGLEAEHLVAGVGDEAGDQRAGGAVDREEVVDVRPRRRRRAGAPA